MKKAFEIPELTIILFTGDDIITASGEYDDYDWGDNPPGGEWND